MKALLAAGADVHAKEGKRGQTALMWAAAEGHAECGGDAHQGWRGFRYRLGTGFHSISVCRPRRPRGRGGLVIESGSRRERNGSNGHRLPAPGLHPGAGVPRPGNSALHLAVVNGHFELAAMLLDAGADPNAAGVGYTPLHIISIVRKPGGGDNDPAPRGSGTMTSLELVKKFAKHGANLNARMTKRVNMGLTGLNTLGATPFLMAARSGDAELMRTLAALGADPLHSECGQCDTTDRGGWAWYALSG